MRRFVDADGNPAGRVWLDAGEPVPFLCECGEMYQPTSFEVERSTCPKCGADNDHDSQEWALVGEES